LTVQASNSRLSSVISAIRSKTGIEFEGGESATDPVALSLGPAPEGEVLSAIFAGSRFDFVAIGRQDSPGVVQRVILTPKTKEGATAADQAPQRPAAGQESDDEDTPDEQVNPPEPQDTPAQPPQPQAQTPPQQQPKSPEQLLQELQQMRQQKNSPPNGDPAADQAPKKPQL
jgi:outer membrane biosynthesis protein TonB